jgi:fructose-1,6-bisphosphatase/inositol monophosphatase family enzyme
MLRDAVLSARDAHDQEALAGVAHVTVSDTIYQIDKLSEEAILSWFEREWPAHLPVQLVMEGLEDAGDVAFPLGTSVEAAAWKCIMDPIDGTRCLMYDKRAAWVLAAVAPHRGSANRAGDLAVAAMTEIPTTRQWRSDQISAVRGRGRAGIRAISTDVRTGERQPITLSPSRATDFKHGFAAISRFFPEGLALTARLEQDLWEEIEGLGCTASPMVFTDQYISTGGQIYEILSGHDRMLGDLRPLVLAKLGLHSSLVCHPYDICTALIAEEAGAIIEQPDGRPLDFPLDTTSPVAWMAYANPTLADRVRPVLAHLLKRHLAEAC